MKAIKMIQNRAKKSMISKFIQVTSRRYGVSLFLCVSLFLLLLLPPTGVLGDEGQAGYFPESFPQVSEGSLETLEKILASEDFGSEKEGWGIRFKQSESDFEIPDIDPAPWMENLRQVFGLTLKFFVIFALAAFICFGFVWFWKNRRLPFRRKAARWKESRNPPDDEVSPESLFLQAEDFFGKENYREAWAACFAGCLQAYRRYHSVTFPADATEYGCLGLVRHAMPDGALSAGTLPDGAMPSGAEGFGELVQNWVLFAYGGRVPCGGAFEKALSFGRSLGVPQ